MVSLNLRSYMLRRGLTAAFALAAVGTVAHAQSSVAAPLVDFRAYSSANVFAAADDQASSSSSSSMGTSADLATTPVDPLHLNAMQYERRRYGRPRYRGSNTNPDGSDKYIFYVGGGFTQPTGNTWKYYTPSWGFQVGGGRQFSSHFAVPVEFNYDNFGLTGQTLKNQFTLYNNQINYYNTICVPSSTNNCPASDLSSLDGNAHVWSFSFQPTYTIYGGDGVGVYVLAGVGFYHKVTNFTTPGTGYYYDPYYGYIPYTANEVIDHYTSNAPGFDAGFGFTYKVSHFSSVKLYAEGRYVFVDNSQRTGVTVLTPVNSTTINVADDFPANSNRTGYFPIKVGIRF